MDKVTEQLIRIEAKLDLILAMVPTAKNEPKEAISYEEYHRRRDEMAVMNEFITNKINQIK